LEFFSMKFETLVQAQLLDPARSTVYQRPRPTSDADLALMHRMDELHLAHPFAGSRMLRDLLDREGVEVGRKHVATLMRRMGMRRQALFRPRAVRRDHPQQARPWNHRDPPGRKPGSARDLGLQRPVGRSRRGLRHRLGPLVGAGDCLNRRSDTRGVAASP